MAQARHGLAIGPTSTKQVSARAYKSEPYHATHDPERPYNVWSYVQGRVVGQYATREEAQAAADALGSNDLGTVRQ